MSRYPPFAMPADIMCGESIAAYTTRKNAALVENRIKTAWIADAHTDLVRLLHEWVTTEKHTPARVAAWAAVERYLVANLQDTPR